MWDYFYSTIMFLVYLFRHGRDYYIITNKATQMYMPRNRRINQMSTQKCFYTYNLRSQRKFFQPHKF